MQSDDTQELQFKKRARRRLVGAIALVLLMITVLPMVLDDRAATQPQQEIAITIPSQDGDDFISSVTPHLPQAPADTVAPQDAPPEPEAAPAAPAARTDAPKPPAAKSAESQARPAPPPAAASYMIQIGVFSDAANVKRLEQKLKELSFTVQTEKLPTAQGEVRLLIGPFASRAAADAALTRVKAAGMPGMIVTGK